MISTTFWAVAGLLSLSTLYTSIQAESTRPGGSLSTTTVYNASTTYLGCYQDPSVSILTQAKLDTIVMTPQYCANWCGQHGFPYAGVEFGT